METAVTKTTTQVPQNTKKIFLSEAWEVNYWCSKFKCTEDELRKAIDAVGNSAVSIDDYLGSS
ncbi:MAG: DUF3606 domain-containing protein [Bacteroidota bacterium]